MAAEYFDWQVNPSPGFAGPVQLFNPFNQVGTAVTDHTIKMS